MSNIDSREPGAQPAEALTAPRQPSPWAKGWAFARLLARVRFVRKLGTLTTHGYLAQSGWVDSVLRDPITIGAGAPLPWATFPYIAFIAERLQREWRVFEYGAGSSTLYYAARVQEVVAVEHDPAFARALAPHLPRNVTVRLEALHSDAYVRAIEAAGGEFDVVSVDGRDRVRCAEAALPRLHRAGVVVLDDAERADYAAATAALRGAGFRRLDFWGLAPGEVSTKSTAVFYRTENCLGL
ncbi:MAG: hypothetical protein RIQ93_366 [Verrucomicrobiota bacterium]|jgi:precorrin-6B methylase 2